MAMLEHLRKDGLGYLIALVATCAMGLVLFALEHLVGGNVAFFPLVIPVLVAGWYGGLRPGLLATGLTVAMTAYFFVSPRFSFQIEHPGQVVGLGLLVLCGAAISLLLEALLGARRRLEGHNSQLQKEIELRRGVELELRQSRARKAAIVSTALDAIITIDHEGKIVEFNPAAEKMFGRSRSEAVGQVMADLIIPPLLRERHRQGIARYLESGEARVLNQRLELSAVGRDGREFPVEVAITRLNPDGPPLFTGYIRDISARKRAEEALLAANDQLRLVTDVMSAPVARCSRDLKYLWVSRDLAQWLGRSPEEIIGRPICEILGPEAFEQLQPHFDEVLAGRPVEYEAEVNYPRIGKRWIHALYRPTFDAAGGTDGWVAVVLDIHERKQFEQTIQEADRRKDEFLATLSHELRNPLAPIRSAVEVLKARELDDPDLAASRDVIDRQVQQMARLLDDLLDVSRITRGKFELRKEALDLAAVINVAVETSRPLIEAGGHELILTHPPAPIRLEADPLRLAQVFANLLNNAAKYTNPGGRIELAVVREGSDVVASVKDNGMGISAEMLPHIFEIFSQATAAVARSQGGLGIGLALIKGLVELHGGSIEVRSAGPGRGSEFLVRLPVVVGKAAAGPTSVSAVEQAMPQCLRILIADDLRDGADTLARMLRIMGNDVRTAYDGEQALAVAQALRPDVIILDIGMPKMNGYEAARRIRQEPWGREVLLIALTGWGQEQDRRRTEEAGFDHHLVKPVDPAYLRSMLAERQPVLN
jgi:PAS domain S-box-containing protein